MKGPLATPPPGEAFARLKQRVIERTGHFYYEDKDDVLWERVRKRLAAARAPNLEAYLERLEDGERGEQEWLALETQLTIGETYFFRYPEQFDALRNTIFPALLEAAAESRRLRIWSAGCATGAEAYSVAILLGEMLGEALSDWRVSILGTDINEDFLATARAAEFGAWALRTLSPDQRKAWFTETGDRWTLRPQHRRLVRFQRGNLLDLMGPAPPLELVEFDLILCRNVLIYFHPQRVAEVAGALVDRLQPHGWLLVGHAEPNPDFGRFADAVGLPGTVAYRPRGEGRSPAEPPIAATWAPLPEPAAELIRYPNPTWAPLPVPEPKPVVPAAPAAPVLQSSPAGPDIDEIRRRADLGDFRAAELKCVEALRVRPDDPVLHFYNGLVEQALGRHAAAEDALRRAAYLAPGFIMAHYHLGLVRIGRGRREAGRRSVAAAAQMAGTLAVDERLPEGAGLTAGELREVARVQLGTSSTGAN